ncbi:hypothetical protein GCM10027053_51020 [Intrasporangium mesophilum]
MTTIHFHDEPHVVPPNVQIDATARKDAHRLSRRLGKAVPPAQPRKVELSERLGPVADIENDLSKETLTASRSGAGPRIEKATGCRQPLLEWKADKQRCLAIGPGPSRRSDGCLLRCRPGNPNRGDRSERTPSVQGDSVDGVPPVVRGDADIDRAQLVAAQSRRDEGRCTIEHGTTAALPDGSPQQRLSHRRMVADDNGVPPGAHPPSRIDLGLDVVAAYPCSAQVATVGDAIG